MVGLAALPLIRQPTLILAGTDDPIIPLVSARIMHALLPHSSLHVYDDGHLGTALPNEPVAHKFEDFVKNLLPRLDSSSFLTITSVLHHPYKRVSGPTTMKVGNS